MVCVTVQPFIRALNVLTQLGEYHPNGISRYAEQRFSTSVLLEEADINVKMKERSLKVQNVL